MPYRGVPCHEEAARRCSRHLGPYPPDHLPVDRICAAATGMGDVAHSVGGQRRTGRAGPTPDVIQVARYR
jgi:hypothetical protein